MKESANDKFLKLQHQIRQNTYSVQDYISELTEWTEEADELDKNVKEGKGVKANNKKLPPIRSVKLENERVKNNKTGSYLDIIKKDDEQPKSKQVNENKKPDYNEYKRDITPMPAYYNKWDKFDTDAALEEVESGTNLKYDKTVGKSGQEITKASKDEKIYQPTEYDEDLTEEEKQQLEKEKFLKGTSGARPNTKLVIKGGATPSPMDKIDSMKKQGNNHFTSLEYERAIECYTK